MKTMTEYEMRNVDGGGNWADFAKACAATRLMYEHWRYGHCMTKYYGLLPKCVVCGKKF